MALFVSGMPCCICGKPMRSANEILMFSPFIADRSDPLFVFSDAIVHTACFVQHPLSDQVTKWHDETVRNQRATERTCAACGKPILNPDDYFGTGLLARDPANPLHEFNFVHLHRSHAEGWTRFAEFRRKMEEAFASGMWQGPRLAFGTALAEKVRWMRRQ